MANNDSERNFSTTEYCHCCGAELTEDNCRQVSASFSMNGLSHLCINCEQDFYEKLARVEGRYIALFHTCAALNVPCKPIVLEGVEDFDSCADPWITYINCLSDKKADRKGKKILTFFDGITNMREIFGKDLTETDFAKYVKSERAKLDKMPGTPEQREKWGVNKEWTTEDYNELDRLYEARASSFKGQTLTLQQENALINVAKWSLKQDKFIDKGNLQGAKALLDMIDKTLAAESMRKKDEKPVEHFRPDAWVVALERAGLMADGKFLNLPDTIAAIDKNLLRRHKYNYSLDVLDQSMLKMYNCIRQNADLAAVYDLPTELTVDDELGEFSPEETAEEKKRKKYANLTPIRKGDTGDGGEE